MARAPLHSTGRASPLDRVAPWTASGPRLPATHARPLRSLLRRRLGPGRAFTGPGAARVLAVRSWVAFAAALATLATLAGCQSESWEQYMDAAAFAYQDGRTEEAEAFFLLAAQVAEELDETDPRRALTLGNLADLYRAQARDEEAESAYLESLALLERIDGPDSPRVARFVADIAVFYTTLGRVEEAEPLYWRALQALEWTHGFYHDDVLELRTVLAGVPAAAGAVPGGGAVVRRGAGDPARHAGAGSRPGPRAHRARRVRGPAARHRTDGRGGGGGGPRERYPGAVLTVRRRRDTGREAEAAEAAPRASDIRRGSDRA